MLPYHSYRKVTKTGISTFSEATALTDLTMLFLEEIWNIWDFRLGKQLNSVIGA